MMPHSRHGMRHGNPGGESTERKKVPRVPTAERQEPGGIQKDELHPSQLTKGEAHKNLAVKRPTAMVAGRGMGTTATIGTAAAAAATAEIAQYGS